MPGSRHPPPRASSSSRGQTSSSSRSRAAPTPSMPAATPPTKIQGGGGGRGGGRQAGRAGGNSRRDGGGGGDAAGHQQPPWKSSLDVAWSYSRSAAHHFPARQGEPSAPSFTEHHWAGPSYASSTDGDEDDDEEEGDEDDEEDEGNEEDYESQSDVDFVAANGEVHDYDGSGLGRGDKVRIKTQMATPELDAEDMIEAGSQSRSGYRFARTRNADDDGDETVTQTIRRRSRSRNRGPKHLVNNHASTRVAPPPAVGSTFLGADGMVKAVRGDASASDTTPSLRVGSHYERYDPRNEARSGQASRVETVDAGAGTERGRGRSRDRLRDARRPEVVTTRSEEHTPLLLSQRGRPRISRMYSENEDRQADDDGHSRRRERTRSNSNRGDEVTPDEQPPNVASRLWAFVSSWCPCVGIRKGQAVGGGGAIN